MDEAAQPVEVFLHVVGIDDQLVDNARQPRQGEVEMHGGIGRDAALDRGMRNVALVPQRHVLQRRGDGRAHQAGKAGEVFGEHRIALVGHGR